MLKRDIKTLIAKAREIAEAHPDHVYEPPGLCLSGPSCLYVHSGNQPGCIFGRALLELGISVEQLRAFQERPSDTTITTLIRTTWGDGQPSDLELLWCQRVQIAQDVAKSWGNAVAEADKLFPLPA